jgi:FtsP/CotA-like multicopper oxidase with cupredoxin domain
MPWLPHRLAAVAAAVLASSAGFVALTGAVLSNRENAPPEVVANDNRAPAGVLSGGTLTVHLHVGVARWHPEAADGPFADVAAFGEDGKSPTIPGPLIRVHAGTTIVATVRNDLTDSTIWVRGLVTHPASADSTPIAPGDTRTFSFLAGQPGTYVYSAKPGHVNVTVDEREQMSSAFIVDPVGRRTDDRVFVINIWGDPVDSTHYRNAVAINGKSWPFTERISANVGDSVRWRVINGSARVHPMHLHGFYFRVDSRGSSFGDTTFGADRRRIAVTEDMDPGSTMAMVFSADRPGNWLFHCHLTFHVNNTARLDGTGGEHLHEADPMKHMAGLVLGIIVNPTPGKVQARPREADVRKLRLFADERPHKGRTPLEMSYVLQRGRVAPAADSVEPAGAVIVLQRNQPTRFTIVNRLHEGTAVHWHGIELLSYSDGVAGWSGASTSVAPMVAAKDSFVANLRLPRAGTFIYHTHLNDIEQVTSGMYGALLVLPEGQRYDPTTDHAFVMGWDGPANVPNILVNGDSLPKPLEMKFGKSHRLRFINIGPADRIFFAVRRDTTTLTWKPRAKDGADLPSGWHVAGPSIVRLNVGETFDADFNPPAPGEYRLTVGRPKTPMAWSQRIIVR